MPRKIIRAMRTWNPAMWAGLTGMASMLATGGLVWWIWLPASLVVWFLMLGAVAVTLSPRATPHREGE